MKKITISSLAIIIAITSFSQEATKQGNILFEVGTTAFGENLIKHGASTGFNILSTDGSTLFSIGAEGGYFIQDNTALKFGLGYTDLDFTKFLTYKFGFKHYAGGNVPVQLDVTGATNEDQNSGFGSVDVPDPLWLGLQVGYAAFLADNISFEPTFRYNASLNKDYTDENIIEVRFNFVIFF